MRTTVKYTSVNENLAELRQAAKKLAMITSEVQTIYNNIDYTSTIGISSKTQLKKTIADINIQYKNIGQLCTAGEQIMSAYQICEAKLAGYDTVSGSVSETPKDNQFENNFHWDTVFELIGSFGTVGGITGVLWGTSDGGTAIWKSGVDLVQTGAETAQTMAEGKLVDVFGTFAAEKKTFTDELSKYVYDPSDSTTVAGKNASKINVAAKWVGVAIDGMLNFLDNFEEYNADYTDPGLYIETVSETALDVLVGIGAGVAASSLFAALGVTSPVAFAVGVTAVGITSVGNMAIEGLELLFNKDINIKENISDFVVDKTKAAGKAVVSVGKMVGNAVKSTADCIAAGWKKITNWF